MASSTEARHPDRQAHPAVVGGISEALLPASVLVELCKELKGIGDQVQVEIDTHEVAFEGMWRWCWRAAAAIAG